MERHRVAVMLTAALALVGGVAGAARIDRPATVSVQAERVPSLLPSVTLPGGVAPIDTSNPDRVIGDVYKRQQLDHHLSVEARQADRRRR